MKTFTLRHGIKKNLFLIIFTLIVLLLNNCNEESNPIQSKQVHLSGKYAKSKEILFDSTSYYSCTANGDSLDSGKIIIDTMLITDTTRYYLFNDLGTSIRFSGSYSDTFNYTFSSNMAYMHPVGTPTDSVIIFPVIFNDGNLLIIDESDYYWYPRPPGLPSCDYCICHHSPLEKFNVKYYSVYEKIR